jgi:hypothetical protein
MDEKIFFANDCRDKYEIYSLSKPTARELREKG